MPLNCSFAGKKILITGGSRGIGRELVQLFHDDGALVFTIAKNPDGIKKLQEELPKVTAAVADLNDWEETRKVVASFGHMDYLVNNAGLVIHQSFMDVTEDAMKQQFNVNIGGTINVSQVVAKGMIEQGSGGVILNIGGVSTRRYVPGVAAFCASKTALESLTRTMAVELGPHNIRVNNIIVGIVNGGVVNPQLMEPALYEWIQNTVDKLIVKRPIETKEVGDMVAFMLSPFSSMMVGESVGFEGGFWNI